MVRYFLCVRDIGEKSLNKLFVTVAYLKSNHYRLSVTKALLKTSQILQEKICVVVSF